MNPQITTTPYSWAQTGRENHGTFTSTALLHRAASRETLPAVSRNTAFTGSAVGRPCFCLKLRLTTYTHRLKSVSNGQITQAMGYDSTGNVTTTTLSGSGGKTIQTTAAYGGSGNRLTSVTDAAGATVSYSYGNSDSVMRSLPTSVTDPNGIVTTSAYDTSGRVTQTGIANTANLLYTYTNGNLSAIQRTNSSGASQTYNFTYDSFGNMLSAKVGSRNLASNIYANGNGQLTKQTYGNGATVNYTYDILGRIKTATYSDGRKLTYAYNGEGQLHSLTETGGGEVVTYVYTYDSIGRLLNSQQLNGENTVLRTSQSYNSSNQLTKQSWQVGGDSYSEDLTYNSSDGSLNTFSIARNGTALTTFTMGYDGLRRLTSMSSGVFTRNYTYRDISDSKTTTQVKSVDYSQTSSNGVTSKFAGYAYTYDDAGNILTSTDNLNNVTTYTYDDQNQLLTESGTVSGFNGPPVSYNNTYTYDTTGNILTSSDGETTHTYTYGDAEWKDLLTAYDGESITYDAIGNPTSYYNGNRWTMGWENGRQLTTLSKQPPVVISTQPENYYGTVGGTASFTVAASGDRVAYQWQCSTDDGETWSNISGGTSTTLNVPIQASVNGNLYRCIAKDYMGHAATSQAGKLTVTSAVSTLSEFDPEFTLINEPDDYYGRPGDTATFIVEAEGANLSYQWLCRAPGSRNFEYLTGETSPTLRVEMTAESEGAEYRCFITDAHGDMGSTRIATVKLDTRDWQMEYNTSGLRTRRISDDKTYSYIYAGDKLMRMTVGDDILDFSYDANGAPLTMTYNGTVYYYITNLQGDVMAVESATGSSVAQYAYDAWGNIIAIMGTLAELNPLRYRGYVYDQETGFYYLQSRYYDPVTARFVNTDMYVSTGQRIVGNNMFAYCNNAPVSSFDHTGKATVTISYGFSITAFISLSYSVAVSIDLNGNIEIQQSYSAPTKREATSIGLLSVGYGPAIHVTNMQNVRDLTGVSTYLGVSSPLPVGLDLVSDAPVASSKGKLVGLQVSGGPTSKGAGLDVHVSQTYTKTVARYTWKDVFKWVKSWASSLFPF